MSRALGGYVGHIPVPSTSSAPGVWTLREASRYRRAGTWPGQPLDLASISGLAVWLDASDASTLYDSTTGGSLVNADGAVARWEDKSGNNRHATQSSSVSRPVRKTGVQGGLSVLRFDGTNDRMGFPSFSISAGATGFIVYRRISGNDGAVWNVSNAAFSSHMPFNDNNFYDQSLSSIRHTFTVLNNSSMIVQSYRSSSSQWQIRRNGVPAFSAAGSVGSLASTCLVGCGADAGGTTASFFMNSDVAEVVVYNASLSDVNLSAVEASLIAKWGIA